MSGNQGPGRDRDSVLSRLDAFNAYVRRLPEWVYWSVVLAVGMVGGAIYLLVTAL